MTELNAEVLNVSQLNTNVEFQSISKAAEQASEGDTIIVDSGTYSKQTTNERFPIYIPPECKFIGAGINSCLIDGGGDLQIASRPVNPYQSLVLLGDKTMLSGFTIFNSGANAVSNEQGARIHIEDNLLRDNGQHGLLVFGTNGAVIQNNQFKNNGVKKECYDPPRATDAKQGHQIFIESRKEAKNEVSIIGNELRETFADGIAVDVFDQPEGVEMRIKIIGNTISDCGRNGLGIASSFGPSNTNVSIEIRNNKIFKTKGSAIDALAAFSLIHRTVHNAKLHLDIIDNKIKDCDCGINAIGAFSPSLNSYVEYNITGNEISQTKRYGIRAIGGVGADNWPVESSICHTKILDNRFYEIGNIPVFVQGGIACNNEKVINNSIQLHLFGNYIEGNKKIIVNDGLPTNLVTLEGNTQPFERKTEIMPFDSP